MLNTDTSPVLTTEHSEITEKQEEANTPEPAIQSLEDTGTDQTDISVTRETPVSAGGTSDPYWLQYTYEKERIITDSVLHVYAVNKNTHKIHEMDCYQVKKILPENYDETIDPDSLIAEGYEWCKICH
ncbi:MAG: hypothetical protein IKZ41_09565 [Clostridia bacterium]|nr:hypothetical protein [Clostridia bacterium]